MKDSVKQLAQIQVYSEKPSRMKTEQPFWATCSLLDCPISKNFSLYPVWAFLAWTICVVSYQPTMDHCEEPNNTFLISLLILVGCCFAFRSLPFSRVNKSSSLCLSSQDKCFNPTCHCSWLLNLLQHFKISFYTGGWERAKNWMQYSGCGLMNDNVWWDNNFPWSIFELNSKILVHFTQDLVDPLWCQDILLTHAHPAVYESPLVLFTRAASQPDSTQPVLLPVIFLPRYRTWHLLLWNLIGFLLVHSSCLPRSFCMVALFSTISDVPSILMWSENLRRLHLVIP